MIHDLDGGDPGPSRAGVVRAISVVLTLGALVSYAALTSPTLRGPYATPDPAAGASLAKLDFPRYTPAPFAVVEPTSVSGMSAGCIVPGSAFATAVFIGGRSVTFEREIVVSPVSSCIWLWSTQRGLPPLDRFAR